MKVKGEEKYLEFGYRSAGIGGPMVYILVELVFGR